VHTNFDFIVCYDIDNVNIEVISIQLLIIIDRRKLVTYIVEHIMSKLVCVVFHAIVLKRKENTDIIHKRSIFL
jgi:hypothetical protein